MIFKDLSLWEFITTLLNKYKNDPISNTIIQTHLTHLKAKQKIAKCDLETLESTLKSSKLSLSPPNTLQSSIKFRKTPNPKLSANLLSNSDTLKPCKSASFHNSKKKTQNVPKNSIFPTESLIDPKQSDEFWRNYRSLCSKLPVDLDVWGKIHQADYIKYKNEEKLKTRLKKLQQSEYKAFLDKQVKDSKKFKESEYLQNSLILPSSFKSISKNLSWRQDLDALVEQKEIKNQQNFRIQTEEDEKFLQNSKKAAKSDLQTAAEKRKKCKELSLGILRQSVAKREKELKHLCENRVKSRELMNERLERMDLFETQQRSEVLHRAMWVHDENRLKKLLPATQKVTDHSETLSLSFGKIDSKRNEKIIENRKALLNQIKEKVERNNWEVEERMEEGERIRKNCLIGIREMKEEVQSKRMRERMVRSELDRQVWKKRENLINERIFTDDEAKINRRIFESSLQVIERNKR